MRMHVGESDALQEYLQCCLRHLPGHFSRHRSRRRAVYFDAKEWEEQSPLEPEPYYQQLRDVFSQKLASSTLTAMSGSVFLSRAAWIQE